jgi:DNA-binding transcriptional LysR family regulator
MASLKVMDLRQLNHLIAVADHGSFSSAARSLHTVQSNVSNHVAKLEKELGTVLLDRRTMQPTPEGQAVISRARRIRAEMKAISDDLLSINEEVEGQVQIGCIGTTARWIITPLLKKLAKAFPSLQPKLIDANTNLLTQKILSGDLDLAIINAPAMNASLESETLFEEERIIVAPAGHPLSEYESISVHDLSKYEMMMASQGTIFRDSLDEELSSAGVEMKITAEIDGLRLLASLAFQGHAPAILPASAASGYPDSNWVLIRINGLLKRPVTLIRNKRITPSLPARATNEVIREVVKEIGPDQPGIKVRI